MKKAIILITVIVGIVGIAAAGAKLTGYDEVIIKELSNIGKKQEKTEKEEPKRPTLVDMETITMTVFADKGEYKNFVISLRLEIPEDKTEEIETKLPRLRDIFVKQLHVVLPQILKHRSYMDLRAVKKVLLRDGRKFLGKDNLKNVLIKNVYER